MPMSTIREELFAMHYMLSGVLPAPTCAALPGCELYYRDTGSNLWSFKTGAWEASEEMPPEHCICAHRNNSTFYAAEEAEEFISKHSAELVSRLKAVLSEDDILANVLRSIKKPIAYFGEILPVVQMYYKGNACWAIENGEWIQIPELPESNGRMVEVSSEDGIMRAHERDLYLIASCQNVIVAALQKAVGIEGELITPNAVVRDTILKLDEAFDCDCLVVPTGTTECYGYKNERWIKVPYVEEVLTSMSSKQSGRYVTIYYNNNFSGESDELVEAFITFYSR